MGMNSDLFQNMQAQPQSLAKVLEYQCGPGHAALLKGAALLRSGKRVLITGMGASMYAGIPLEYFLCSRGIDAFVAESAELLYYRQPAVANSVIIMISRSGESVEVTKLVVAFKDRAPIIGVTNVADSTLARESDCPLVVGSPADASIAIQTYTGTVLALQLLGRAAVNELPTTCAEVEAVLPLLAGSIAENLRDRTGWDNFLDSGTPVYFLGRGPSCASTYEGVLLFHETAKSASVGMPAASFRHGPMEVVDASFSAMIFAPMGRTRELNTGLACDLAKFGGQIRVIGPRDPHFAGLRWCATPILPEMLAPLADIVPVQCAALRLAELKGLKIGSFRYTPMITRNEAGFAPSADARGTSGVS
jgi:glucosamine--fructose-6-phosphate aminotransferase (isomerizing)